MSDIEEHRKKIEEITLEMIKLLKTRTDIAKQIGDAKANLGMTVTDEEREDALRTQVTKLCKEIDLDQSTALKFLNLLLNESVKVQSDGKQTHLSVFLKAKALEEEGKKIIHLEVGEPDFKPPKEVKTALEEVYDKGYGKYGPAKGITELRKALALDITAKMAEYDFRIIRRKHNGLSRCKIRSLLGNNYTAKSW